jgi:hypothetical protein
MLEHNNYDSVTYYVKIMCLCILIGIKINVLECVDGQTATTWERPSNCHLSCALTGS